jgi:ribonucleoside-diphosphate reductase alpha chain
MFGTEQIEFLKNKNYLKKGETLQDRINDIVEVVRTYEPMYSEGLADRIKDSIEQQILSPSTPQWANIGRPARANSTDLPCSCNIITVPDSIAGIYYSIGETAMLSKLGAGVGTDFSGVSDKGTYLDEGFHSNSKLDWIEDTVRTSQKVSQGATRRGYSVPFVSIDDTEFYDLLKRAHKTNPDKNDPFVDNNVGIILPKGFRERVSNGDGEARKRFLTVLQLRQADGKIYLLDVENCNKNQSPVYEKLGHLVSATNICTEAITPKYNDKTFACVLSSLNLVHWDKIKANPQIIKDAIMFLDIIVEEYIRLTDGVAFLDKARRSAIEKRDIGLGTLGFHEYIQSKGCAYGDLKSRKLNKEIYSTLRKYAEEATQEMAEKLGSPKMCEDAGLVRRNVSLMMVAPNKSTSFICGNTSLGIEPFRSNYFIKALAGIQSVFKNKYLEALLEEKGQNTNEVWESIMSNLGSVKHLEFLTDEEKSIFKTASEISPKDMIDLAADRQEFIDMGQSLNLFNRPNYTIKDIYDMHKYAFDSGIKTLYYFYPQAHAAFEQNGDSWDTCESCAD